MYHLVLQISEAIILLNMLGIERIKMYYSTHYESPIGTCLIVSDEKNIVGLWFLGQEYFCPLKEEIIEKEQPVLIHVKKWLDRYFAGKRPPLSELSLAPKGSEFRQEVWNILCRIPSGSVMTYGEIAKEIAKKQGKSRMSAQAVGGAVAHNPISIIIPCHRVIGSNKSLTGYAGSIEKKLWLLNHEKAKI